MITYDGISINTIRSGKGDCILLHYIGVSGNANNVIIDSGPTSAAGEFRNLLTSIMSENEKLSALFITHYDEDHIGGFLKVGDLGFQNIFFNAYEGEEPSENLSAVQNQRLFHALPAAKVHPSVMAGDLIEIDGAKITIHAPNREQLKNAAKRMKEADKQLALVSDWKFTLDELMERKYPVSDSSPSNQASIVFTFEYHGIRLLFCGDAWAGSIPGGRYDLVKLPHHGSTRNLSDDLLSRIDTDTFLICADGTTHPNKQTIAKLLQHYGSLIIYSNYSWWMNRFLKPEDMKYIRNGSLEFRYS